MTIWIKPVAILGIVSLSGAGLAVAAGTTAPATAIQCGIGATTLNGITTLAATVLSPTAISGNYSLAIASSGSGGSSNVRQGGDFAAAANAVTTLGQVSVNAGSKAKVSFTITSGGQTIDCSSTAV